MGGDGPSDVSTTHLQVMQMGVWEVFVESKGAQRDVGVLLRLERSTKTRTRGKNCDHSRFPAARSIHQRPQLSLILHPLIPKHHDIH